EDPRAIEARARKDLGMIRAGETVFLLPERNGPEH
ncbi:MAG: septum formation initiator family protein, partial [Proteobacteria bacterium]|nr:septum formation initiator family protein [Pseudomonadota bacterium]